MEIQYIDSASKQFEYYKKLGEKTFAQLSEEQLRWKPNEESNSIAIIVQHLHGNMLSRWTDFLTSDGEKPWRARDNEFENMSVNASEVLILWDEGWSCLFEALSKLDDTDLKRTILIRSQELSVMDAIHRQLAHYAYHVGQMVFIGKLLLDNQWQTLSIAKGGSEAFNASLSHKTNQDSNR